jgi:hypothetical protein
MPYNEVDLERDGEIEGLGRALHGAVTEWLGIPYDTTTARIEKAIFKGTVCGAWIQFTETGLSVGSIVEGSDVDCESHHLTWTGEEDVGKWLNESLKVIEDEATELWNEANQEETDDT